MKPHFKNILARFAAAVARAPEPATEKTPAPARTEPQDARPADAAPKAAPAAQRSPAPPAAAAPAPAIPNSEAGNTSNAPPPPDAASPRTLTAHEIADACTAAGVPSITAMLVKAGITNADAVQEEIFRATDLHALVKRAHGINEDIPLALAETFISMGATVEQAKGVIGEMLPVMQSPEINSARPTDATTDHGWGDVIAKSKAKK